jgi:hypothetical protein
MGYDLCDACAHAFVGIDERNNLRAALAAVTEERDALREALEQIARYEIVAGKPCVDLYMRGTARAALERSAPE